MSYLKTLVLGYAKSHCFGLCYSGKCFLEYTTDKIWKAYGNFRSKKDIFFEASQMEPHISSVLHNFSDTVSNFVNLQKE